VAIPITAKTRTAVLFGYPIGHSFSPVFQNAALQESGIDAVYICLQIAPERLRPAVETLRSPNFLGANLTIPHKEAALSFLDEVAPTALKTGSVNTIVNCGGRLRGETTDGAAFLRSLKEEIGVEPACRRVFLVGAGGAGRAIAFALVEADASVYLANRSVEKAEKLMRDLQRSYPGKAISLVPFSERRSFIREEGMDVLIDATSIGLSNEEELFAGSDLPAGLIVCDLIYHHKTRLIEAAEKRGLKNMGGLGMLVHQGALSFELWTGRKAPVAAMFASVKNYVG